MASANSDNRRRRAKRIGIATTICAYVGLLCVLVGLGVHFVSLSYLVSFRIGEIVAASIYTLSAFSLVGLAVSAVLAGRAPAWCVAPVILLALFAALTWRLNIIRTLFMTGGLKELNTNTCERWGRVILTSGKYRPTTEEDATVDSGLPTDFGSRPPDSVVVTLNPFGAERTKTPCAEFIWYDGFENQAIIVAQEPLRVECPDPAAFFEIRRNIYYCDWDTSVNGPCQ